MSNNSPPTLPPLPPPVGSSVLPSAIAGSPPPPSSPPPAAPSAPADVVDSAYGPPEWLRQQRGEHRTSNLDPKFVVIGVVAIVVLFVLGGVIMAFVGTSDPGFGEYEPVFEDQPVTIES